MKRKLIGQVGVDSGQLMVIDPCYIDSSWKSEGKITGVKFWGQGENEVAEYLKSKGATVEEKSGSYRVSSGDRDYLEKVRDEIKLHSSLIQMTVITSFITESSYDEICDITGNSNQGGEFAGLGVAFTSGLGDGGYNVYATYKDLGAWGERITKVEIVLIDEDEIEEYKQNSDLEGE